MNFHVIIKAKFAVFFNYFVLSIIPLLTCTMAGFYHLNIQSQ